LINRNKTGPSGQEVKKFGILFAAICAAAWVYLLFKESPAWIWFGLGTVFFATTGFLAQPILRPVYVVWMKFAFALGWINTRILLGIFFYLIITPIGLVMRLVGKDILDQKLDRSAKTYWKKRDRVPFDQKRMEHQF
jgi:hypothetical protein